MARNALQTLTSTLLFPALLAGLVAIASTTAHAELSVVSGSQAPGQPGVRVATTDWVYTLQPGESFSDVAESLLRKSIPSARLLHHNGIGKAAVVEAGDKLNIPLAWLQRQPDPARIVAVSGQVSLISRSDGQKRPLTQDSLVRVGDEIVSSSGTATVELADGSKVRISPGSKLIFNRLTQYGKSGMVDTRLRLDRGEVNTQVRPAAGGESRFQIETPSAVAAVRGTVFSMQTLPGETSLQVTEGVVTFGPPGKTRSIPAGYSASVNTATASDMTIRRLPPPPRLNPVPDTLTRLPAELSWQPGPSPTYRVDIFDEETGRWVESEETGRHNYQLDRLDNGSYQIRVAALDSRGVAGMPGTASVNVDLQARGAQLLEPEDGATVNDDMPEFRWQFRGDNEVGRVEIAEDKSFSDLIASSEWAPDNSALPSRPLTPGQYHWRVVTEAGGNSVATSATRELIINGSLPPVNIISINYLDSQVRVFWEKVDTASEYRLQLAEEPGFNNIIKEATVADTTAALRLIPGRRYFVRLKALSDGPLAGRWGPGRELFLE